MDADVLRNWVGRQEQSLDNIALIPANALAATLDWQNAGLSERDPLPELWHWLYFLAMPTMSELDMDGHPHRGGFLPPVALPRRMWAGSRLQFLSPLCIGDKIRRVSTIQGVELKEGASGQLVFVTVLHHIYAQDASAVPERLAIEEEQDIVYREASVAGVSTPSPVSEQAQWSEQVEPTEALLFRYSALTFNAHRIHYDRPYAINVEGYDGLVVHGPLTATLLLGFLHKHLPDVTVARFNFRGLKPLLDTGSFRLEGRKEGNTVLLWVLDASGAMTMRAEAMIV